MTPQDAPRNQFEQRMRLRRAATCVSAARVALESGRTLEAQERLEEACRLDPEGLEARILLEQLKGVEPEAPEELILPLEDSIPAGARRWSHWVAVLVAVVALAFLAWWRVPTQDESRMAPARPSEHRVVPQPEPPAAVELRPAQPQPRAAGETGDPASSGFEGGDQAAAGTVPTPSSGDRAEPNTSTVPPEQARGTAGQEPSSVFRSEPSPARQAQTPPGTSVPALTVEQQARVERAPAAPAPAPPAADPVEAPAQSAPAPSSAVPVPQSVEELAANTSPAAAMPIPPAPSSADAAKASLRDDAAEEEAIGQVLGEYADAYNRLDAGAARRVWPTVDERALRRAFAGLESQGITFEGCDLSVNGVEATASCRGRARYVPKVGDREAVSQDRNWRFRLHRGPAGWQIVQAEAR